MTSNWAPAGPAAVDRVVYRGRESVPEGLLRSGDLDESRFEEAEVRDLDDSVLWLGRVHMRGRASRR